MKNQRFIELSYGYGFDRNTGDIFDDGNDIIFNFDVTERETISVNTLNEIVRIYNMAFNQGIEAGKNQKILEIKQVLTIKG